MNLKAPQLLLVAPLALALACAPRESSRPAGGQPPGQSPPPAAGREAEPSEKEIRGMLRDPHFGKGSLQALVGMGERAFPAFEKILADPGRDPYSVCSIYCVLHNGRADPGRFREHAVADLAHPDVSIRRSAVGFLARVGSPGDVPPVVALLSDTEWTVSVAAAKTLAAIGDWRAVNAMDAWLDANGRAAGHLLRHVKECRDELKRRLEAQLMSRDFPLPTAPAPHPRAADGA